MDSNQFDTLKKLQKLFQLIENFNFGTLDEAFQTQSFGLSETSQKYFSKIKNSLVVPQIVCDHQNQFLEQ